MPYAAEGATGTMVTHYLPSGMDPRVGDFCLNTKYATIAQITEVTTNYVRTLGLMDWSVYRSSSRAPTSTRPRAPRARRR